MTSAGHIYSTPSHRCIKYSGDYSDVESFTCQLSVVLLLTPVSIHARLERVWHWYNLHIFLLDDILIAHHYHSAYILCDVVVVFPGTAAAAASGISFFFLSLYGDGWHCSFASPVMNLSSPRVMSFCRNPFRVDLPDPFDWPGTQSMSCHFVIRLCMREWGRSKKKEEE